MDQMPYNRCAGFMAARGDDAGSGLVLLGAPMDWTSSHRPGSRFGPRALREASYALEEYSLALGLDLGEVAFFDAGDVVLPIGDIEGSLTLIERTTREAVDAGRLPFLLGGEHLISLAAVRAVGRAHGDLAVVVLDAHADLRDDYMGLRHSHATVMRRVAELVGPGNLYQAGVRSCTREELEYQREFGVEWAEFNEPGLRRIAERVQGRPVYLSIDIDVVDPAYAPGTGAPEPGGISPRELFSGLDALRDMKVVGMDVVELCPPHDPSGITALLAAKIVREALLCFGTVTPQER